MALFDYLRSRYCKIVFSMVMVIQVINLSIDAVDPSPYEDLTINEIESCVEFVLEILLGHTDAIEETDDQDHSSHGPGVPILLFSSTPISIKVINSFCLLGQQNANAYATRFESMNQSVISPPPKFAVAL